MSGRHRRPEPDPLLDADLAERMEPGPVVEVDAAPGPPATSTVPAGAAPRVSAPGSRSARQARAAERARRRAARRRRALLVGGAAVALLLVALTVVVVVLRDDATVQAPPTNAATDEQRTLLAQVTGPDGVAAASALFGMNPVQGTASTVLIPSGLLVDVPGTGSVPFGETTTLPEQTAPTQALTDLLGVRIDDAWALSTEGFAGLVDAVGGVRAAVDVDVRRTDDDGEATVVVRAGTQQLSGAEAAAYATYLAEEEPEQARLARFHEVLNQLLAELPDDRAQVAAFLNGLEEGSVATLDGTDLAQRLLWLKEAATNQDLVSDVLPLTEIDAGGSVPTYGIDSGQASAMMRARFPGALQTDRTGAVLRVLVENGVGTPGLVEQARAKLVDAGFRFVNGGNAAEFTDAPSTVFVPDGTQESVRAGERVAEALALPETSLAISERGQTVADVIVVLGSDFRP